MLEAKLWVTMFLIVIDSVAVDFSSSNSSPSEDFKIKNDDDTMRKSYLLKY